MADTTSYKKLRKNILIMTLCFAIVPMIAVGIIIPMQFTSLYHEKTIREVENVAQSKGRTIDIFFEERIAQLKSLAGMYTYEEMTQPGRLTELLRILQNNSQSYVDLGIIDLEGNHKAYAGAYNVQHVNYKDQPWFTEVQRRGVFVSDVFMGFRQFPHIIIAVMRLEGNRSWILRATIDSEVFNSIVQASKLSAEGDAFVVNRDNVLQTSSRFAGALMTEAPIKWPAGRAISFSGSLGNKEMLFAKIPLTHAPWSLVVAEDPREHLSLLLKTKVFAGTIVFFGLLALCLSIWLTTRMLVGRLEQADKEKATLNSTILQSSKMAALGKLAAGVAHEVNNPLMLIRQTAGWINDLMEEEEPHAVKNYKEISDAAHKIEQHVDRAKDITHRLLGFARRVDPTTESLPLNPIVDQAISFLQNEATFRSITLEKRFSAHGPRVSTDVGQIQQVILNIIDNALDATPTGGAVFITTGADDKHAFISVRDTGPGIPDDKVKNIFDPFFSTKPVGEGTGLGLSICYSIMEGLGGSIEAANSSEGGAEFLIKLPLPV